MFRKVTLLLFLITITTIAFAQLEPEKKKVGRPDIPGTFMMEFGFNRLWKYPQELSIGFWGSRTLNLYYLYDKQFGQSKFSVHSGIGFGFERYKLQDVKQYYSTDTIKYVNPTLTINASGNTAFSPSGTYVYGDSTEAVKKSMFITNYFDVPLEFRFSTNPNDPSRSFKVSLGGRVGFLLNAQTKLVYREDGETKKLKDRQDFNLSPIRYSAYSRVGVGNFYLSFYYNFNPLFKPDKGPSQTDTSNYTITLSLASF